MLDRTARKSESAELGTIKAIEPDSDLFTVAEQVDLAEKDFHDAVARRNEAHIEYLRQPSIKHRSRYHAPQFEIVYGSADLLNAVAH